MARKKTKDTQAQLVSVEISDRHTVVGPAGNPVIQALINGEPLPQRQADEARREAIRRGETPPVKTFGRVVVMSRAQLFGGDGEHGYGLIQEYVFRYFRDHPNPFNLEVEREFGGLHIQAGDRWHRMITVSAQPVSTGADVVVSCNSGIETADRARDIALYHASLELAQALAVELDRLDRDARGMATPLAETSASDGQAKHPGNPGLPENEVIYRLAKAQERNEIKASNQDMKEKEIAKEIGWNKGAAKSGIKLLEEARHRLERLEASDPDNRLPKVAEYREKEKRKTR